ncbi:hypothetical protein [Litoribrevibacter albus]|uniref:Uncharacterized protein n=1 Tax=Litoribrevibacter albus TaxID=1473156 RepID=A0AA37S7M5_9GAMM|nr:hypothetical protein [Litoribrevibacter albus]GLQ29523.1 hypothetical protein GCM10007876_00010 [Litoribrevibacter albus]
MNQPFIYNTLFFIENSDLHLMLPNIDHLNVSEDGGVGISIELSDSLCKNRLNGNWFLTQSIFFSLLDSIIDLNSPNLEGASFKRRYEDLDQSSPKKLVFKELYRVVKLIRNTIVHQKSAIDSNENGLSISYTNTRGTQFSFCITNLGVRLLHTVCFLVCKTFKQDSFYIEYIINSYYELMLSEISGMSDEFGSSLNRNNGLDKLPSTSIYRVRDTKYTFSGENQTYFVSTLARAKRDPNRAYEYIIKVQSSLYIVPHERISENGAITKEEIDKWLVKPTDYLAEKM